MVLGLMSWVLVVQPDRIQADALREALRSHISEDIVVAASIDDALAAIDRGIPDLILLPPLIPAAVEDYLLTYLGARPGAGHVRILGLPHFEFADEPVAPQARSWFPWRRRRHVPPRVVKAHGYEPGMFTQDVAAYLAGARKIKDEIALNYRMNAALGGGMDRRREQRFANSEVPWISLVRFGGERAALLDVSARGARLRTHSRPDLQFLKRQESHVLRPARLTIELESEREFHALGRVIRCVPSKAGARTYYEIAFSFDDSIGLHLPEAGALVSLRDEDEDDELKALRVNGPWAPTLTRAIAVRSPRVLEPAAVYF